MHRRRLDSLNQAPSAACVSCHMRRLPHTSVATTWSGLPALLKTGHRHLYARHMLATPLRPVKDESEELQATPLSAQGPQWRQDVAAALEHMEVNYGETLLEEWGANLDRFHEAPCRQWAGSEFIWVQWCEHLFVHQS